MIKQYKNRILSINAIECMEKEEIYHEENISYSSML